MDIMRLRPSHAESYERLCHDARLPRFLMDLRQDAELQHRLAEPRLERYIGVVYRPQSELASHYAQASLSRQFDAYVWFDESRAVTPLAAAPTRAGVPATYPFGL